MQHYTLETTDKDFTAGRINLTEHEAINAFIVARDEYHSAEEYLGSIFSYKYSEKIKNGNMQELKEIKEELRIMPDSASKTLLFRAIIMREDELMKDKQIMTCKSCNKISVTEIYCLHCGSTNIHHDDTMPF